MEVVVVTGYKTCKKLQSNQNVFFLDFTGTKYYGGAGGNWSYKTSKAPVKSSPPNNQHPSFSQAGYTLPVANQQCQSTEGKYEHIIKGKL